MCVVVCVLHRSESALAPALLQAVSGQALTPLQRQVVPCVTQHLDAVGVMEGEESSGGELSTSVLSALQCVVAAKARRSAGAAAADGVLALVLAPSDAVQALSSECQRLSAGLSVRHVTLTAAKDSAASDGVLRSGGAEVVIGSAEAVKAAFERAVLSAQRLVCVVLHHTDRMTEASEGEAAVRSVLDRCALHTPAIKSVPHTHSAYNALWGLV